MMMTFPFLEIIVPVGAVIQNDSFNCFEDLYLYVTWLIIWYNITIHLHENNNNTLAGLL